MADQILSVDFKINTGNIEGDAAAAGKLAAKAFEQGFGALDLKTPMAKGAKDAQEQAAAIGTALHAATVPHAAPGGEARPSGEAREGGRAAREGGRGGEGEGSPLHKGIEGLTSAMEGLTKLIEGGSTLGGASILLRGLTGLGGSALDAGEGLAGASLFKRLAERLGSAGRAGSELEGAGPLFGAERSAMAGAAGRMAALRRGEEAEVISQRLRQLGLGGGARAAGEATGGAEGIASAGGGLLGGLGRFLPGAGSGATLGASVGGPAGAAIGGVLGGALGGYAIEKVTEGAAKGAEAIKDVGLEAAQTDVRLHHMAEIMGTSFEGFMRVREVAAKGGVDLDDWARGITRLAIQTRKELPEVERQYEDSGNVLTESNIKVRESERGITEARLKREAATDQTIRAETALGVEQKLGSETRGEEREAARLGVSGAAVGAEGAQVRLAQAALKRMFAPQEEALQDVTGPLAVENAGVNLGSALSQAWGADIRARQVSGEPVSREEIKDQRVQAAWQASAAANEQVKNARVALQAAVLKNDERQAAEDKGVGPVGEAQLGFDQARQGAAQAALAQKQAVTQQQLVNVMTSLDTTLKGPALQRGVEEAKTQEEKAADTQKQAGIDEQRAKINQRIGALYDNLPTVGKALQGQPPEMQEGEGAYDFSQIPPDVLRSALLHRGTELGGGALGGINAMGEAIQKVSDLHPSDKQFGLGAVSALFPSLRGFRGQEGPEALMKLVGLVNSPAARGPGGLAAALTPDQLEELQGYIDLNEKKLPDAKALTSKLHDFATTREQQQQLTGLAAIPAAGAVIGTEKVGTQVGGGVAQTVLEGLNSAASGIGSALSGVGGKIEAGASSVGAALESLAGKLSGWSPPAPQPAPAADQAAGGAEGSGAPSEVNATEKASGGLISGAGSGTSDSNLAWVSDGEYIVKADRVQQLGVPFLDQINAGKFAVGGLIRGFAEGGAVDDDQAKTKAALEQLRLKMPLFGKGVFDDPDWATPLGDKIRLEHADKIKPPAEAGGGAEYDETPPAPQARLAEMWRSRRHPADADRPVPLGEAKGETPDAKEQDDMADVFVNGKKFRGHKGHGPSGPVGPDQDAFAAMFGDQLKNEPRSKSHAPDDLHWEGGLLVDAKGNYHNAEDMALHSPKRRTAGGKAALEIPFDSLPEVHERASAGKHDGRSQWSGADRARSGERSFWSDQDRARSGDRSFWSAQDRDRTGYSFGGLARAFADGGLARVSNGEYRIGASAVTKYGAGVMAMLNSGTFSSGGLVGDTSNPGRFDDWGNGLSRGLSASLPPGISTQDRGSHSEHTLDLVTHAGQFRMQASADTIEAIRASAIGQKLTSAGTKPSWY